MTVDPVPDPGADLARWAASSDRPALERALAAAADPAYAQALRLLGRASDAEDATQEALVQLVRSARRYDPARPFRPWLARLVHDACSRLLRSDRRRRRHEAQAVVDASAVPAEVDAEAVRAAVLALPEGMRAAVELHYLAGLSQAETAASLGIAENACAVRLLRARDRLRGLLRRRGIDAVPAAVIAVLAVPGQSAPPGLAGGIAAQAAAGTLPATTIPLGILQHGTWFMSTHPVATTTAAAAIAAAAVLPFAMTAGEAPPPVPPAPAVAPPTAWGGAARPLLAYLDDAAALRIAVDLDALRPQLMRAKPFTALADPQLAKLVQSGRDALAGAGGSAKDTFWMRLLRQFAEEGHGLAISMRDTTQGQRQAGRLSYPMEQRLLAVADLGGDGTRLAEIFATYKTARARNGAHADEHDGPPPVGPFAGLASEDGGVLFIGRDAGRLAIATRGWLSDRLSAPPAAPPAAAASFRFEGRSLVAGYADRSAPAEDQRRIALALGEGWRTCRPVVSGTIGVDGETITGEVVVTGAAPFSPLLPVRDLGTGYLQTWPAKRPLIAIPPSADRVAAFSLGLRPGAAPEIPAAGPVGRLMASVVDDWSGDLAVELRPGTPLPRVAVVLGLRTGADPAAVARRLAAVVGLPSAVLDQPGNLPRTLDGVVGGGQLSLGIHTDRLVATWNADASEWPGIATATAAADAPAASLVVDLPAASRSWWPLVAMTAPEALRRQFPTQPAVAAHLPVWQVRWDATADGIRISERGLPLATGWIAATSLELVSRADPLRATRQQAPEAKPVQPAPAGF